jgi:hypothetical protein
MNTPKCEKCDGRTYLSRREPHPTASHHELHTFRCASCEHAQVCEVDLGPNDATQLRVGTAIKER